MLVFYLSLKDQIMRFPVTVDGHFLTKAVDELYENHELLKIPFITGVNSDEGGWLLPGVSMNLCMSPPLCN